MAGAIKLITVHDGEPGPAGPPSVTAGSVALTDGQFPINVGGTLVARDFNTKVAAAPSVTALTPASWGDHIEGGTSAPGTVRGLEINVLHPDIGADPTGAASSVAAMNAARTRVTATGAHQKTITYPAGTYLIDSALTAISGATDVTIRGAGRNATILNMSAAGVNVFNLANFSRITIEDLTILSFAAPLASGIAITAAGTSGTHADGLRLHRVRIQNIPTPITLQYVDQLILDDVQVCQTVAGAVSSVGLLIDTCVSVKVNHFQNIITTGTFGNDCIRILNDCDTVYLDAPEVGTATGSGIRIMNSTGATGPRLVRIVAPYSESNSQAGYRIDAGRDIVLVAPESANNGDGFDIYGGNGVSIDNPSAIQNQIFGIWIGGGKAVSVNGGRATNNSQQSSGSYDGAMIDAGVTHASIRGLRSGDYLFTPSTQRYGLTIAATTDYIIAQGCDLTGNLTGGLNNASTGTHTSVSGNL